MVTGATIQRLPGTDFTPPVSEGSIHHAAHSYKETMIVADILNDPDSRAQLSPGAQSLLEMCVDPKTGFMLSNRHANAFWRLITSGTVPYRAAPGGYAADSSGASNGGGGIAVAQHLQVRLNLCHVLIGSCSPIAFRPPGVPQGCC